MAPDALLSSSLLELLSNLFYEIEDYLTVQVCLHHILNKWSILQLACSTEFVPKMHYKSVKHMILLKSLRSPSNDEDELVGCAHSAYPFFGLGLELILIFYSSIVPHL